MFDLENFIEDCKSAIQKDPTHCTVADLLRGAMSNPSDVMTALGEPTSSGLNTIYKSSELTILNVVWKPEMVLMPHDHNMWATIGIYTGREDNVFWRRIKDDPKGRIEAAGAKALATGDVAPLGKDVIHSVINPIPRLTGALHIYGGDFFEAERLEWEAEGLTEQRFDPEVLKARFAD